MQSTKGKSEVTILHFLAVFKYYKKFALNSICTVNPTNSSNLHVLRFARTLMSPS